MNLLIIVSNYPHAGHPYAGAFNERSVRALKELEHQVEVLAPRPYVPRIVAVCNARWRAYGQIAEYEVRRGISVYRPAYLQLPGLGGAVCPNLGAYLSCVRELKHRHSVKGFDGILAFNLIGAGGLAWRLGRRLGIPAAGWATGNDVRVPAHSSYGRAVRVALQRLNLVLYQSAELLERAAALCNAAGVALRDNRDAVLPRGIEMPPPMSEAVRQRVRAKLGLRASQIVVLYVGRIIEAKGVFELVEATALARKEQAEIVCVLVGAHAGFDDSVALRQRLRQAPDLSRHVQLLPACPPEQVWRYLNAADIFGFPSHSEGMPNSLLEAMVAGVPSVAYAIPPVLEIDNRLTALKTVPPLNIRELARALVELANSREQRQLIGERGKERVLSQYLAKKSMAEAVRRLNGLRLRSPVLLPLRARTPILSVRSPRSGVVGESEQGEKAT